MPLNYTPTPTIPAATQSILAQTDRVIGGASGAANVPHKQFADNIAYLHALSRADVEALTNGKMTKRTDNLGQEDLFYVLRKFQPEWLSGKATWDAGNYHRAFRVNSVEKDEILVSVLPAVEATVDSTDTVAQALGVEPSNLSISDLRAKIATKGAGYHLMTCYEYGALCLDGLAVRQEIPGNTSDGKAYAASFDANDQQFGVLSDIASHYYTYPGSGPIAWNHNNSPWGVADLIGNYYEWIDGIKLVGTQITMMGLDNNYSLAETSWVSTGIYYDNDGSGNLELDITGASSLTLSDQWQDISLSAALLAAGNAYAESVLVDAMISPEFEDGGSAQTTAILGNVKGSVNLTVSGPTIENYFIVGGDYDTGVGAGCGTRISVLDAAGSPSPAALVGRYCLIE